MKSAILESRSDLQNYLPSSQVVDDVSIEIRHDHDIELLRARDQLHARVVDDHRVELDTGVPLGNLKNRLLG